MEASTFALFWVFPTVLEANWRENENKRGRKYEFNLQISLPSCQILTLVDIGKSYDNGDVVGGDSLSMVMANTSLDS